MTVYSPGIERQQLLKREQRTLQRSYERHKSALEQFYDEGKKHAAILGSGTHLVPYLIKASRVREQITSKEDINPEVVQSMLEITEGIFEEVGAPKSIINSSDPMRFYKLFVELTEDLTKKWQTEYNLTLRNLEQIQKEIERPEKRYFVPAATRDRVLDALKRDLEKSPRVGPGWIIKMPKDDTAEPGKEESINEALRAYFDALEQWKPKLPREQLQTIAKSMHAKLEAAMQSEQKQKQEYARTPEGTMLRFAFYQFEHKRIASEPNGEHEDKKYHLYLLQDQAADVLEELKQFGEQENNSLVDLLQQKGYLKEDEASFVKTILERLYEQKETQTTVQDEADRDLCSQWLQESYEFSPDQIRTLLPHITSASITHLEQSLDAAVNMVGRRALIQANPELLLMGTRETQRYIDLLKATIDICRPYVLRDREQYVRWDMEQHPLLFASKDNLVKARQSLEALIRSGQEQVQELSVREQMERRLESEGFDADSILHVVRGFRAAGKYHWGTHGLGEDSIFANIRRELPQGIDERTISGTLRMLQNQGVVLRNSGKFSLNPHLNDIASEALKGLMEWISRTREKL